MEYTKMVKGRGYAVPAKLFTSYEEILKNAEIDTAFTGKLDSMMC